MPGLYRHPPQPWQLPPHVVNPPDIAGQLPIPSRRNFPAGGSIGSAIRGLYPVPSRRKINQGAITTAEFTLFIAGVARHYQVNTLNITQPISQSATASFDIYDNFGSVHFQVGQEVLMYEKGVRIFGGTIDDVMEAWKPSSLGNILSVIKCVDFSNILDRHIAARYYSSVDASLTNMVQDITSVELFADGIVYDSSDGNPGGPAFGPQLFQAQTIRQIFNTLSNLAQWDYNIDYYKVLRFFPRSSGRGTAPFTIADGDKNVLSDAYAAAAGTTSISIRTYRTAYRNVQYATSSTGQSPVYADIFSAAHPGPFPNSPQPPDGTRFFFVTKYGIISTPTVTVNGVSQRVVPFTSFPLPPGSWDWYWIPQQGAPNPSPGVGQNPVIAPLGPTDVLIVGYPTLVAPVITVTCPAQIAARAAIEGNSGIYADIQPAANITDPTAINEFALGLLNRYGCLDGMPTQVMYSTLRAGVFAGMLQQIQRSHPLITSAIRQITNVSIRDVDGQYLVYTITADSGRYQGNWTEFFGQIQTAVQLPQPQNRMTYRWQIYPTVPGVTNPGGTGGVQLQIQMVANPFEIFSYIMVGMATPLTADLDVQINVNGSSTGSFTVPSGTGTPQTFYYVSLDKHLAGDSLQVVINPRGLIKDITVQLVTAVVVSA